MTEDRTTPGLCDYCRKTDCADGYTTKKVIHRKWNDVLGRQCVGETNFTVCNNGKCGGYLQMSFEG